MSHANARHRGNDWPQCDEAYQRTRSCVAQGRTKKWRQGDQDAADEDGSDQTHCPCRVVVARVGALLSRESLDHPEFRDTKHQIEWHCRQSEQAEILRNQEPRKRERARERDGLGASESDGSPKHRDTGGASKGTALAPRRFRSGQRRGFSR